MCLKDKIDKERNISHLLHYSSNDYKMRGWVRLNPGIKNSIQVSQVGAGAKTLGLCPVVFPEALAGNWIGSWASGPQTSIWIWAASVPGSYAMTLGSAVYSDAFTFLILFVRTFSPSQIVKLGTLSLRKINSSSGKFGNDTNLKSCIVVVTFIWNWTEMVPFHKVHKIVGLALYFKSFSSYCGI